MTALYCPTCQKVHEFRRPHAVRRGLEVSWRDVGEIVIGVPILLILFFGVPFTLWLLASGVR